MENFLEILEVGSKIFIAAAVISVFLNTIDPSKTVIKEFKKESSYVSRTLDNSEIEKFIGSDCTGTDIMYLVNNYLVGSFYAQIQKDLGSTEYLELTEENGIAAINDETECKIFRADFHYSCIGIRNQAGEVVGLRFSRI